ncbi:hypothetical protein SASPL_119758 [Salvia splendens]|uniref:Uncharacterized protein n=1 Tax=Salvia splendens TaxID=180675 RepID=A0A8X8XR53_SALSN|nr:hypothetical protein SASPL_119758 [Salvia splendens]
MPDSDEALLMVRHQKSPNLMHSIKLGVFLMFLTAELGPCLVDSRLTIDSIWTNKPHSQHGDTDRLQYV